MKTILLLAVICLMVVACSRPVAVSNRSKDSATREADERWKKVLTPQRYAIMRDKETELPFSGEYDAFFKPGTYVCAACGQELFASDTKFDSGSGWPSFYTAKAGNRVKLVSDAPPGLFRTEVLCSNCGSHLGHVFDDAPQTPTGQRYCINSISLKFIPEGEPIPAATQPK